LTGGEYASGLLQKNYKTLRSNEGFVTLNKWLIKQLVLTGSKSVSEDVTRGCQNLAER
jgi:hypothetical protein